MIYNAQKKFNFTYTYDSNHIEVIFNDYHLKLPNFLKYYKNNLDCINFISIPTSSKIKIEEYYLRHYLENPIPLNDETLIKILEFITENS